MNEGKFIEVEVEGKDKKTWQNLKAKLIETINKSLDTVINYDNQSTIRDEAKEFTIALLNHAKAKLNRAGVENDKIIAEIELTYSQRSKELAEARKINAEAQAIEFKNAVNNLRLSLSGMKALLIGENDNTDIVFLNQIDFLLNSISENHSLT